MGQKRFRNGSVLWSLPFKYETLILSMILYYLVWNFILLTQARAQATIRDCPDSNTMKTDSGFNIGSHILPIYPILASICSSHMLPIYPILASICSSHMLVFWGILAPMSCSRRERFKGTLPPMTGSRRERFNGVLAPISGSYGGHIVWHTLD